MLYDSYKKIILKGERVDWYDTEVPVDLLTPLVIKVAENIVEQINKYEDGGVDKPSRNDYIKSLWENVRNLPYTLNGDFFLKKKIEIESEMKPKRSKTVQKVTKNSQKIFGNK